MQSLSTRKSSQRDVSKGWFYGSQFHTNIQHCKGSRARVMPGDWLNLVIIASWPPLSSSQYSFVTKPKKHRDPDMATLSTCWSVAWGVDACLFFKLLGFFFPDFGPHLAEALCGYPLLNIFVAHHLIGLKLNTSTVNLNTHPPKQPISGPCQTKHTKAGDKKKKGANSPTIFQAQSAHLTVETTEAPVHLLLTADSLRISLYTSWRFLPFGPRFLGAKSSKILKPASQVGRIST